MDILSVILSKQSRNSLFKFHHNYKKTKLVSLSFVDDILLLSRGDPKSAMILKEGLDLFTSFSGMSLNPAKNRCYMCNVNVGDRATIISLLGISEDTPPFNYLGIPLASKGLKASDCLPLLHYLQNKINSWHNRFLSFGGRLQLI